MPWQWNNDSRPAMGCHGAYAQGGRRSLDGRCKLSLNKNGARPTNHSKGYLLALIGTSDMISQDTTTTTPTQAARTTLHKEEGPCRKMERRDHEKKREAI